MRLRQGMRVRELTKKGGQPARQGTVLAVRDSSTEVRWEDGRVSSLSGAYLYPIKQRR